MEATRKGSIWYKIVDGNQLFAFDKETNEIIRFSTTENPKPTEWLEHQSAENDYFLRIPNVLDSVTHIYAHFFPATLYDYEEDTQIFSIYDFSDFIKHFSL